MFDAVNWHSLFFLLFAAIACWFAVAVVVSGNIVRMACYLVVSLTAVAGLFFLAGADFLGAAQLMVYVGGTMVLLVFGVMLTTRGPFVSMKTGGGLWILGIIIGVALLAVLLQSAFGISQWAGPNAAVVGGDSRRQIVGGDSRRQIVGGDSRRRLDTADNRRQESPPTGQLGMGLLGVRTDRLDQPDALRREGMSGYLLPFEIISVHLVVVLIGAAFLARARRRTGRKTPALSREDTAQVVDYLLKKM